MKYWSGPHSLTDLCVEVRSGFWGASHPDTERNVSVGVVRNGDISRAGLLTGTAARYFSPSEAARARVEPGDILFTGNGDIGKTHLAWRADLSVSNFVKKLRPDRQRVDPRFLLHALGTDAVAEAVLRHSGGSTIQNLRKSFFDEPLIRLPSMQEQQRIVDILEDHLSRLDAGAALLDQVGRRAARLRESWLHTNLPTDVPEHERFQIRDALVSSRGGWSRSRRHIVGEDQGTPYLKMNNITRKGQLDLSGVVRVAASPEQRQRYCVQAGDVLFNSKNSGDLVGKTAVADSRVDGWLYNENIIRLRFDDRLSPEYVGLWFLGQSMRSQIVGAASASTNVAAVYMHSLRGFTLWIPDPIVQRDMVSHYRDFDEALAQLTRATSHAERRLSSLRRALLAAAFSGRLTGNASDLDLAEEMASA